MSALAALCGAVCCHALGLFQSAVTEGLFDVVVCHGALSFHDYSQSWQIISKPMPFSVQAVQHSLPQTLQR